MPGLHFRRHRRNLKEILVTPGSDNEDDDFNDFTMNKGFIQHSVTFSDT